MNRARYSDEHILAIVKEGEAGRKVADPMPFSVLGGWVPESTATSTSLSAPEVPAAVNPNRETAAIHPRPAMNGTMRSSTASTSAMIAAAG